MMKNENIVCSSDVAELYSKLNKQYRYMINMKDEYIDNLHHIATSIRKQFSELGYSDETISDMLIQYLYKNKKRAKQLFWFCYGQYAVNNLQNNIKVKPTKFIQCVDCGEWIEVDTNSKAIRCPQCQKAERQRINHENYLKKKIQTS